MAVPKKKKSSSRSGMRRGSNGTFDANFLNVIIDKESGEYKLPHHICQETYGELKINLKKAHRREQQKEQLLAKSNNESSEQSSIDNNQDAESNKNNQ